ncbi:SRPBCC family protein [Georgenia deserti]|uniref:SRPBCC family protein n=1 Tax=Georgenia deserti TaxID=2093781 RepID=A0ABW4L8G3_9MICO
MSPRPTAVVDDTTQPPRVVFTRHFRAPIEDVWEAVSDPARLERWIGTYSGDPASGHVTFRMTAEEDAGDEEVAIHRCEPPHHWSVTTSSDGQSWSFTLTLTEDDGGTRLEFAQVLTDPAELQSFGPGWEYYLDRLAADLRGAQADEVRWEDYYPTMADYFATLRR